MNKLQQIQQELKAPKNRKNSFGNYKYRSCEDILEAVKPLLEKYDCILTLSDEMVEVGGRVYVKAVANIYSNEDKSGVEITGWAREAETKKGMDDSQITGTASSYARKYALNGLFLIDDTKDADTDEHHNQLHQPKKATERLTAVYKANISKKLLDLNTKEEIKSAEGKTLASAEWTDDQEATLRGLFQARIDEIELNKPIKDEIPHG